MAVAAWAPMLNPNTSTKGKTAYLTRDFMSALSKGKNKTTEIHRIFQVSRVSWETWKGVLCGCRFETANILSVLFPYSIY